MLDKSACQVEEGELLEVAGRATSCWVPEVHEFFSRGGVPDLRTERAEMSMTPASDPSTRGWTVVDGGRVVCAVGVRSARAYFPLLKASGASDHPVE